MLINFLGTVITFTIVEPSKTVTETVSLKSFGVVISLIRKMKKEKQD